MKYKINYILIYSFSIFIMTCTKSTQPIINSTGPDTTSHDFIWQTYEFGGVNGSSYFKDVAIIAPDDIWAVGEIHTKDTDHWNADSTRWLQPYNAAHWDGNKWELKRIYFNLCPNGTYLSSYPIEAVFSTNKNNIWFTEGGSIVYWDGSRYKRDCSVNGILTGGIRKIWGISNKDLYVVGTNGLIAHYDGQEWTRIESGTDLPIQDIWGDQGQIIAIASSHHYPERKVLEIENQTVKALAASGLYYVLGGVWFIKNRKYFIVGDGIFEKHFLNDLKWYRYPLNQIACCYSGAIRGSGISDIVIVGDFSDISHFNGSSWKEYKNLYNNQDQLVSVDIKENLIAAAGNRYINGINDKGLIIIGRR